MSRSVPRYCLHKPTGQARVIIDGKHVYLGVHGSRESHRRYAAEIADWHARQECAPSDVTIRQLAVLYMQHCRKHYRKNGELTSEVQTVRDALKRLLRMYRSKPAAEFSPRMLKAVRQKMVDAKLARTTINGAMARIRRMFRWAVGEELVKPDVLVALKAVPDLRRGRSDAREPEPVKPVAEAVINKTLPKVSEQVRDMVRLQLLSGCRPAEIVSLRPCDIDRDGDVWEASIGDHKTAHHGRERRLYFGPKAQAILAAYLDNRPADAPCFSPAEAEAARRAAQRASRKTPVQPSQRDRSKPEARRKVGTAYTVASYRRAIQRGCELAKVGTWSPNQLRHSRATDLRKRFGLEAAKTVCGHSKVETTLLYAETDFARARAIMAEVG